MNSRKKYSILFILCIVFFASCADEDKPKPISEKPESDMELLLSYMIGSFSSEEQAQNDSEYYDIRLEMVQIWKEHPVGSWLYVEQASASNLDKPYRQRVYHLTQESDGKFQSEVFVLRNPLRFAGAFKEIQLLAGQMPDSLGLREGCEIVVEKDTSNLFIGGTVGNGCASALAGATYATSEVKIGPDEIYSWDKGFDSDGNQVWGAPNGGYSFKRIK